MRVLSWNMAHNPASWEALEGLRDQEGIDVALLQEASLPPSARPERHVWPDPSTLPVWQTTLPGYPRHWRTAVVWWDDLELAGMECAPLAEVHEDDADRLPESYPGTLAAVRLGDTTLVSLYAPWEHLPGHRGSYSLAALHRAISDLTRLWFGHTDPRVLIAGDWNVWFNYGDAPNWSVRQWSKRSDTVFDRLAAEGLVLAGPFGEGPLESCPCGPREDCRHVQTFWHERQEDATPYQVDYVVATTPVRVSALRVVTTLDEQTLRSARFSDHAALVFDID